MRSKILGSCVLAVGFVLFVACSNKPPPPTQVSALLSAAVNINPDRNGRPSPIVVRVYELKSENVFKGADFFSLFEQDSAILGADLVNRVEYQMDPGEVIQYDREFANDSSYLGVIAAYRNLENARWRASMVILPKQKNKFSVSLDHLNIAISTAL